MKSVLYGLVLFCLAGVTMAAIEEPTYRVTEQAGAFELRAYQPKILAETFVSGSMRQASNKGFRLIADYIFGNNTASGGGSDKISMTTPVTVQPKSEKISMTAPVTIEQDGAKWRVHFVMPSKYTLDSLPKPNNPAVTLRQEPTRNYAVIRFSGFTGERKVQAKTQQLLNWLANKGIRPTGEPEIARYDTPWTLPFLRRNEVMVAY